MKIDNNKLYRVIEAMHDYFKEQKEDYAIVEYPNSIEYKSNEWLIYMFYSCLLDYGMRSRIYHQNLIATYNKFPEIFNSKIVIEKFWNNPELLLDILKNNLHPRYPNIAVKKWFNLSLELNKTNNVLEKIKSFNSFNELMLYIKSINGFGQKTGGLLLRLIYESGICNFSDELPSIPLDRHDIEISYLNNIIECKNLKEKEIADLSKCYIDNGKKLGIQPNLVDKYLWEIGNRFCNKKDCRNCPLFNSCKTKI